MIKQGETEETKFGMWDQGARKQWYVIDKTKEIKQQLQEIENQYIHSLAAEA